MENIKTFFGNPYYLMTVVLAIAAFGFAASHHQFDTGTSPKERSR